MEESAGFLGGYLEELLAYSGDFDGRRPGGILFLCAKCYYDMYAALDEKLEQVDHDRESYVLYGVLLNRGYRVSFYKWERHPDGTVTKVVCHTIYTFRRPYEVREIIGPTIRGMLNEVQDNSELEVLEGGIHVKAHSESERADPKWLDYPAIMFKPSMWRLNGEAPPGVSYL
ncbi:hypothetical protein SELMODRAFT_423058 [Selaginella moellendorffii]|uniref:Uncharacterized protein n=1 Tax=Selaginella moellendorffii TaxID=88036 RepID=D8SKF2_SELML|nr:hypothetical protein SELMODRAFT_423058 [Selaginella moellendorffii]